MTKGAVYLGIGAGIALILAASLLVGMSRRQLAERLVSIDGDDLGGVVTSAKGAEGGVTSSPICQRRTTAWTRGYGLVDSPPVQSAPGMTVNVTAVVAPNPRAVADYYPANYWYSLLRIPAKNEFPGTGPEGNGIAPTIQSQAQWIRQMKTDGCEPCHQLGDKATREIPLNDDS